MIRGFYNHFIHTSKNINIILFLFNSSTGSYSCPTTGVAVVDGSEGARGGSTSSRGAGLLSPGCWLIDLVVIAMDLENGKVVENSVISHKQRQTDDA